MHPRSAPAAGFFLHSRSVTDLAIERVSNVPRSIWHTTNQLRRALLQSLGGGWGARGGASEGDEDQAKARARKSAASTAASAAPAPSLLSASAGCYVYHTRVLIAVRGRVLRCAYMYKHVCIHTYISRLVHTYFLQDFEDCCCRGPSGKSAWSLLGASWKPLEPS